MILNPTKYTAFLASLIATLSEGRLLLPDNGGGEEPISFMEHDDASQATKIAYYVLLVLFTIIAVMGVVNICLAQRIRKSSKPIWTFYIFSEIVVVFRVLLFTDPFVDWGDATYVLLLISMPSYLYLLVGLAQVMLNCESIMRYKNFKILEMQAATKCEVKRIRARNQRCIDTAYIVLYLLMTFFIAFFVIKEVICLADSCDFQGSYFGPIYLSIANLFVWFLLALTTCSFVSMLNKRFGEEHFRTHKCKLILFLSVFSLSFFVRGTYDLVITVRTPKKQSEQEMALLIFFVYFSTEWLPIFVIYLSHLLAFVELQKDKRRRKKSFDKAVKDGEQNELLGGPQRALSSSGGDLSELAEGQTKIDEFRMLMVNGQRSPSSSGYQSRGSPAQQLNHSGMSGGGQILGTNGNSQNLSTVGNSGETSLAQRIAQSQRSGSSPCKVFEKQLLPGQTEGSQQLLQQHFAQGADNLDALAAEKQMTTSDVDQRTEYGDQQYIPATRNTEFALSNHDEAQLRRDNQQVESYLESNVDQEETVAFDEPTQGRIRLSLFRTENGTQWFPNGQQNVQQMRRTDLMLSNTLQPISSDAGGHSNEHGDSSLGGHLAMPMMSLVKQTDSSTSQVNQLGVMKKTQHSDSALVASYIQEVNNMTVDESVHHPVHTIDASLLDSPRQEDAEPHLPDFYRQSEQE